MSKREEMKPPISTAEERCRLRGYHRVARLSGPGYEGKRLYGCQDCYKTGSRQEGFEFGD